MFELKFIRENQNVSVGNFKLTSEDIIELIFFEEIKNFNSEQKSNMDLFKFAFLVQDWKIALRTLKEILQTGKTEPYFKDLLDKSKIRMRELGFKTLFLETEVFKSIDYLKELNLLLPTLKEKFKVDDVLVNLSNY